MECDGDDEEHDDEEYDDKGGIFNQKTDNFSKKNNMPTLIMTLETMTSMMVMVMRRK